MDESSFLSFYLKTSTIRVFKKSIRALEYPSYVRFLIHPTKLQIAMTTYDKKELTSFRVSSRILNVETDASLCIYSKKLCGLIARKMGWEHGKSYRIPGICLLGEKAFVFYLNEARDVTRETHQDEC